MVKEIPLQNGMVALVDDEDFERVSQFNWSINLKNNGTTLNVLRVEQHENKTKTISLRRYILGVSEDVYVIQLNDNQLDFRKNNLKIVTKKQKDTRRKGNRNATSNFKGVCFDKRSMKWLATITNDGKRKYLGLFANEEDAAKAYNAAAFKLWGKDAYLNDLSTLNYSSTKTIETGNLYRTSKHINKTSFYRGVYYAIGENKWKSKVSNFHIGTFESEEEAAKAYDQKAYELYGDKAILNFPELIDEYRVMSCKQ